MILFDLIVSQNITELSRGSALNDKCMHICLKSRSSMSKSFSLAYAIKNPEFLSEPKLNLASRKFARQNYWQKIADSIWEQPIFLSAPSKLHDRYAIELNYLNTHKEHGGNKYLVSRFSKSLLEGSISSSISTDLNAPLRLLSGVHYKWRKIFKLRQEKIMSLFQTNIYQDYLKRAKKYFSCYASINHFPLFAVSNSLGQMIISEPPGELEKKKDLLDYVWPAPEAEKLHQGWFFTSFEDAQEYMESISKYYNLSNDHLKVFVCNFSAFYNIADRFNHKVYFRLLPDLGEVGNLIKKYRHYGNISFHKKQKHGAKYFQGQPLYMLKTKEHQEEYFNAYNATSLKRYNPVFTSYETAYSVLRKATSKSSSSKFKMPDLVIYNLESFIEDELAKSKSQHSSFLLVPSENAYWFTKKHFLRTNIDLACDTIASRIWSIQLWSRRVFWSLTSKQPYGW